MLRKTLSISSGFKRLLIFVGMPASSKSTMAKILLMLFQSLNHGRGHKEFKLLTMSSLITKELNDKHSPLHAEILPYVPKMQGGRLLNDPLTLKILDKHLVCEYWDGGRVMLLDGCVRNVTQGEAVLETNIPWDMIHLWVRDEEISLERIARRAVEQDRPDDAKPEAVKERFYQYGTQTFPVLSQYNHKDPKCVHQIDASLPFEERVEAILKAIKCSRQEISHMMEELRKPGTPANNYMRKTLGLEPVSSPLIVTGAPVAV
jgi:adenylate kinase